MADSYNPGADLKAGDEFVSAVTAQERKTAAYNALAKTYGVALAGDPDTAIKAQEFNQKELTNPIAVNKAQADLTGQDLTNAGTQETNNYNVLANPVRLRGLQDTNAQNEQTTAFEAQLQPGKVAQQGAALDQTKAQTGLATAETAHANAETKQANLSAATAEGAQARQATMGMLAGLSDTAANGGDIGAQFDKIAPEIAKFEGTTPDHLASLRAKLIADPVGTINSLSDAINAANATAMKNTPAGVLAQQKYADQRAGQVQALGVTAQRTMAVPAATDEARALIPQMANSAVVRKALAMKPGSPEYKFDQLVTQIKTNASLDDLRALRASGTSLGRVTNTEFTASANAFANLDVGQDKNMLVGNLARLKTTYGTINDNLRADAERLSKAPSTGGVHVTPKADKSAPAQFQNGTVYTDAAGNKATTSDGGKTWTAVQ